MEVTGNCMTMVANFEGGIEVVITDCEGPLSHIERHRDGRAAGFYVGLCRGQPDTEGGVEVDVELAYACSKVAPPDAEAIGSLLQEALARAITLPNNVFRKTPNDPSEGNCPHRLHALLGQGVWTTTQRP